MLGGYQDHPSTVLLASSFNHALTQVTLAGHSARNLSVNLPCCFGTLTSWNKSDLNKWNCRTFLKQFWSSALGTALSTNHANALSALTSGCYWFVWRASLLSNVEADQQGKFGRRNWAQLAVENAKTTSNNRELPFTDMLATCSKHGLRKSRDSLRRTKRVMAPKIERRADFLWAVTRMLMRISLQHMLLERKHSWARTILLKGQFLKVVAITIIPHFVGKLPV